LPLLKFQPSYFAIKIIIH